MELKTQAKVFDLQSLRSVVVYKTKEWQPPNNVASALEVLKNDKDTLLKVLISGLAELERQSMRQEPDGWINSETDEPFTGEPVIETVQFRQLLKGLYPIAAPGLKGKAAKETTAKFVFGDQKLRELALIALRSGNVATEDEDEE